MLSDVRHVTPPHQHTSTKKTPLGARKKLNMVKIVVNIEKMGRGVDEDGRGRTTEGRTLIRGKDEASMPKRGLQGLELGSSSAYLSVQINNFCTGIIGSKTGVTHFLGDSSPGKHLHPFLVAHF